MLKRRRVFFGDFIDVDSKDTLLQGCPGNRGSFTPRLNGKVERSHRIDAQEFYQLLDRDGVSDDIHLYNDKLREWENYYNYDRPHGALDGQTPYERLLQKTRATVLPTS